MPTDSPNILLIITDHHAHHLHRRPGEFTFPQPALDRLASEGARFDRAYSVSPICTPARTSMMTGVYPSTHGLVWNTDGGMGSLNRLDIKQGQPLYSHLLSTAGYRNAYVGKWHCGRDRLPVDYGIEGWSLPDYGKVYMADAYSDYCAGRGIGDPTALIEHAANRPEWEGTKQVLHDQSPWTFMNCSGVLDGPPEAHEEDFVAALSIEKIQELAATGQPFSMVASFWGPHQAYFPTEPYASMVKPEDIPEYPSFQDDYIGKPARHYLQRDLHHSGIRRWRDWSTWQEILARCYGQIIQTDAAIGRILDSLDALGIADNTVVIMCADHGDAVASHDGLWDKASTYIEEVARVPMYVRWPKKFSGDTAVDRPVNNMDVTATMIDAAGVEVPEWMHSRSLLPVCVDPATSEYPDHIVAEHNGHGEIILQRISVEGSYKYVAALFDGDELYDLDADPFERANLVADPAFAETKARLRKKIIEHIDRTRDQRARQLRHTLELGL